MKPPPFTYHDPRTVEETLSLLANLEDAKILAGGQSLMPMLNMRLAYPENLIDINQVQGLAGISVYDDQHVLRVGTMTRQRVAERSPIVRQNASLLAEALTHVGHFQTRNRGTVGGSLAHMDASAEIVAVASALDAVLHVASSTGMRQINMADFPQGPLATALESDELLIAVDLPVWAGNVGSAYIEFARRHGDFAIVGAAIQVQVSAGRVRRASIALVGLGPRPLRAAAVEEALLGAPIVGAESHRAVEMAAELCGEMSATGDPHAPASYRRSLAKTLVRRGLGTAFSRAHEREKSR